MNAPLPALQSQIRLKYAKNYNMFKTDSYHPKNIDILIFPKAYTDKDLVRWNVKIIACISFKYETHILTGKRKRQSQCFMKKSHSVSRLFEHKMPRPKLKTAFNLVKEQNTFV